jgi:cell division protein FtsB
LSIIYTRQQQRQLDDKEVCVLSTLFEWHQLITVSKKEWEALRLKVVQQEERLKQLDKTRTQLERKVKGLEEGDKRGLEAGK